MVEVATCARSATCPIVRSGSDIHPLDLKSGSTIKVKPWTNDSHRRITTPTTPDFTGLAGLIAALSMVFGRKGDARLAVRLSGMESGDMVVDVGCGTGVAVRHAVRRGAIVTGVDPAPVTLGVARLLTFRPAKARYVEGAAEAIPLPEGSASVVWSIATVHDWADIDAGLREVRRVLAPVVVSLPWNGGRNEAPEVAKAMGEPTNKPSPSWNGAANMALPVFVCNERPSGGDPPSAWERARPDVVVPYEGAAQLSA
jgi:SAM-dependent methyltransferase